MLLLALLSPLALLNPSFKTVMPAGVESSGIVVINRCAANTHIPFWYIDEFDQRTTYGEILSLNNGKVPRSFSIPVVTESIIYFSKKFIFLSSVCGAG